MCLKKGVLNLFAISIYSVLNIHMSTDDTNLNRFHICVIYFYLGNTPLMYACAGGHVEVVRCLLEAHANVEDHNENGHTPLMEAASAGHVEVAKLLLEYGAGVNTHSNEFKESALTLACYKGIIAIFLSICFIKYTFIRIMKGSMS